MSPNIDLMLSNILKCSSFSFKKTISLRKVIFEIFSISKNNIVGAEAIMVLQYSQKSHHLTCFSTITFAIFQSEHCYNSSFLSLCGDGGLKLSRNMQVLNS
jgi:hypothetical protein